MRDEIAMMVGYKTFSGVRYEDDLAEEPDTPATVSNKSVHS